MNRVQCVLCKMHGLLNTHTDGKATLASARFLHTENRALTQYSEKKIHLNILYYCYRRCGGGGDGGGC